MKKLIPKTADFLPGKKIFLRQGGETLFSNSQELPSGFVLGIEVPNAPGNYNVQTQAGAIVLVVPERVPWGYSTGAFGDGTFASGASIPEGPIGMEIFLDFTNTSGLIIPGDPEYGPTHTMWWHDDAVWSSTFTEAGDLLVAADASYAVNKNTGEVAWVYISSGTNEPSSVHFYYNNSIVCINEKYTIFYNDSEEPNPGNFNQAIILKTQTGEVIYRGDFSDLGATVTWLYYTNWFQLPQDNQFLMITDNNTAWPYKRTYIITIDEETDEVSLVLHPHSSPPVPDGETELFGSYYNYSPNVMMIMDRVTGDYFFFNIDNGAWSRFDSSHQLIWTYMIPEDIEGQITGYENMDYSRMSIAGDRLLLVSSNGMSWTPRLSAYSIDIATGTDFRYPPFDFEEFMFTSPGWLSVYNDGFGETLAPKLVNKNTNEIPIIFPSSNLAGDTLAIGAINAQTMEIRIVVENIGDYYNEDAFVYFLNLSDPYFGSIQMDVAGNYFCGLSDQEKNDMLLLKFNLEEGVLSLNKVDSGFTLDSISMNISQFSDGRLYIFGNSPMMILRSGEPHRVPTGREVSLTAGTWYDKYSDVWQPGRMGDVGRGEGYYIGVSGELSGGHIPTTSRRVLNISNGVETHVPWLLYNYASGFASLFQYDENTWIFKRWADTYTAPTRPRLFNLLDYSVTELDDVLTEWPPAGMTVNSTNYRFRSALRLENGNILVVFNKVSVTVGTKLFEWTGAAWDAKPDVVNKGLYGGMHEGKYYALDTATPGESYTVSEFNFTTNTWSTYDTGTVPAVVTEYAGFEQNVGVVSSTMSNSGRIMFSNTLEYDIPSQTFAEVPIDIHPNDAFAGTAASGVFLRANVVTYGGMLFRRERSATISGRGTQFLRARALGNVTSPY